MFGRTVRKSRRRSESKAAALQSSSRMAKQLLQLSYVGGPVLLSILRKLTHLLINQCIVSLIWSLVKLHQKRCLKDKLRDKVFSVFP